MEYVELGYFGILNVVFKCLLDFSSVVFISMSSFCCSTSWLYVVIVVWSCLRSFVACIWFDRVVLSMVAHGCPLDVYVWSCELDLSTSDDMVVYFLFNLQQFCECCHLGSELLPRRRSRVTH